MKKTLVFLTGICLLLTIVSCQLTAQNSTPLPTVIAQPPSPTAMITPTTKAALTISPVTPLPTLDTIFVDPQEFGLPPACFSFLNIRDSDGNRIWTEIVFSESWPPRTNCRPLEQGKIIGWPRNAEENNFDCVLVADDIAIANEGPWRLFFRKKVDTTDIVCSREPPYLRVGKTAVVFSDDYLFISPAVEVKP